MQTVTTRPSSGQHRTDTFLTPQEVAELFQVSVRTIRRWGASGDLERVRLARQTTRYTVDSVAAFIARATPTPPVKDG